MANVFDYSASAIGTTGFAPHPVSLTNLFGSVGGTVVSQQYAETGHVTRSISYPDSAEFATETLTSVYRIDAQGSPLPLEPGEASPLGQQLLDFAPSSFAEVRNQFGYATIEENNRGSYVTVEGIAAPSIVFDLPSTASDPGAAFQAYEAARAGVFTNMLSSVNAILDRDLASVPSIHIEGWASSESLSAPEFVLTYTPDPDTDLRLRDVFNIENSGGFQGSVLSGSVVLTGIIHDAHASSQKLLFYVQVSPEARG